MAEKTKPTIEKKSRTVLGILALVALFIFLMFTFGSSEGVLIGMVATGILGAVLIFTESGIVRYFAESGYKTFTFGDIMVFFGAIVGAILLIFSLSLIPTIGQILPIALLSFITTTARVITGIGILVILVFIFTPRFK